MKLKMSMKLLVRLNHFTPELGPNRSSLTSLTFTPFATELYVDLAKSEV